MQSTRLMLLLSMLSIAFGGRLEELCVGEGGSVLPEMSLSDLHLGFQVDHTDVAAVHNLTESALYPLHIMGDFDEAMIRVHALNKEFLVNLEPGHAGVECRSMNKGNHDATIWLSTKPSASYVQLLSLGTVTIDIWVTVNATILGYDRYSFKVVPDDEELVLVSELRENAGNVVINSVVVPADDIPTPSPSAHLNGTLTTPMLDSVVLPSENTPTEGMPSPSQSPFYTGVTFLPTRTSLPTSTSSPTYREPCVLCGDPSARVTNPGAVASIMELKVSCGVLQSWADENSLSQNTCSQALSSVAENCACQPSPAPSIVLTFPPTSTMLPTITSSPSYSTKCILDVDSQCFDAHASVNMLGLAYPCKLIVEQGIQGYLSPDTCSVARKAFERGDCTCAPTASPVRVPTITSIPSYTEQCEVCVGDDAITVEVFEEVFTCGGLRAFAESRLIAPNVCSEAQRIAKLECGCPVEDADMSTSSPAASPVIIPKSPAASKALFIGMSSTVMTTATVVFATLPFLLS